MMARSDRDRLSPAEIETLLAALKRDKISVGWLWPWLYRRGWQMPPPRFWPFSMKVVAIGLLCWSMRGGDDQWLIWLAIGAVVFAVLFSLTILLIGWSGRRSRWRQLAAIIVFSAIAVLCIIRFPPPSLPRHFDLASLAMVCLPLFVCWAVGHGLLPPADRLPRWSDYVEAALSGDRAVP